MISRFGIYFPHVIPISGRQWNSLDLLSPSRLIVERGLPPIIFYRQLADYLNKLHLEAAQPVYASHLNLFGTLQTVYRYLIDAIAEEVVPGVLEDAMKRGGFNPDGIEVLQAVERFVELFPPGSVLSGTESAVEWFAAGTLKHRMVLRELLLLHLSVENPATISFRELFCDEELDQLSLYKAIAINTHAALNGGPSLRLLRCTVGEALWAPVKVAPDSLEKQINYVLSNWRDILPQELLDEMATSLDILLEEEREFGGCGEPGPLPVLEFRRDNSLHGRMGAGRGDSIFSGYDYPEYEGFSRDADWMSNVILMAKLVYVWLDQLSRSHGYPITRLDQVPDAELDRLAAWGFNGLWLIGLWERSPASQRIKQICGNPEAIASAYSLFDYEVAEDLGGWPALATLRKRAGQRGIRLASDMVPNHTGIHSRWVIQHPEWFIQSDYLPFPTYRFNGEDLSTESGVCIQIEDGYWSKHDAAVVFKHYDRSEGRTRFIYHGNDGTSTPWNDTAQLNYLIPEVREAVIQTILHVARNFQIIRFDAAMTLAKKHYQRLWFPVRGHGGGIPSRAEHSMSKEEFDAVFPVEFWREVVDRVALEVPDTLLLAEAFWMMEGYFVRTLGMHRVYNSAFMNMLKMEENHKYQHTLKNVLEFDREVLKRFVNFMNNPDEKTAIEQFGSQEKYFGACVMLATMPGLPMFGHGQIEGFHEKYGMEYKRAYWDEEVDEDLVYGHEMWIFPLLRRRYLFSGSENFMLYDFHVCDSINQNVFAYSNRFDSQCSLVIYHNFYSTAAGWIRESTGYAVKNGAGESEIFRTTLGEALMLKDDNGMYCTFRDHATGMTYLRDASELFECGLYVELKAYQFYVFLDFCTFHDDADGNWGQLCERLNGRGVKCLEEELKQVKYATLNDDFKSLIEMIQSVWISPQTLSDIAIKARDFFIEMNRHLPASEISNRPDDQVVRVQSRINRFAVLLKMNPDAGAAKSYKARLSAFIGSLDNCRLLAAWILLSGRDADTLDRFGLNRTLLLMMCGGEEFHKIKILSSLLSLKELSVLTPHIFSTPASRELLAVHDSGGIEWFEKENFENLNEWMTLLSLLDFSLYGASVETILAEMANLDIIFNSTNELAALAGYRTGLYRRMLASAKEKINAKNTRKNNHRTS